MIEYYRAYNKANHDAFVKPMEGCKDLLKILKKRGYKVGIVSSKKKEIVLMGTDLCNITGYIDVFVTEDDVVTAKPSPALSSPPVVNRGSIAFFMSEIPLPLSRTFMMIVLSSAISPFM